jgi:hypothetical protein
MALVIASAVWSVWVLAVCHEPESSLNLHCHWALFDLLNKVILSPRIVRGLGVVGELVWNRNFKLFTDKRTVKRRLKFKFYLGFGRPKINNTNIELFNLMIFHIRTTLF